MSGPAAVPIERRAFALPRLASGSLLPRVLGIYIAVAAGTVQLLDIIVDRLALNERIFLFAIVVAVLGIPFAAAGALLFDAARSERRRPRSQTAAGSAAIHTAGPPTDAPAHATRRAAGSEETTGDTTELTRRLELVLSYRHIALLHEETGDATEARRHRVRSAAELERLMAELDALRSDLADD
jgi:hypothetical protein